jgi:Protein of unknown function DUF262
MGETLDEIEELALDDSGEGSESEEDLGRVDPSLVNKAVVTGTDWTADTILKQLEKGNIALDPVFQRRDAWNDKRKSKFIESIILGLPIPQIVLAESQESKGTFVVIDGKQRLLTLQRFAGIGLDSDDEPLKLSGLTVREDLNGKTLADLQNNAQLSRYLAAFENQTIRTVVVRNWQNERILWLIFHRLNTTSVALSPQELRQALHPGEFLRFAAKYSEESPGLKKTLKLNKPDFRMRDVELLVRYYAYKNFLPDYPGNLKEFLDNTCKELNRQWKRRENDLREQAEQLERGIKTVFKIFGPTGAFRKWDGAKFERSPNRAVFDIMTYYFSQAPVRKASRAASSEVKEAFKALCTNDERFRRSVETTTKSIEANSVRFSRWGRVLSNTIGLAIDIPKFKRAAGKK